MASHRFHHPRHSPAETGTDGRTVRVVTPGLVGLTMSGGSQVDADGALDEVDLEVSGGSTASLERLVVSNLVVQISGGSSARVNASDAIEGDVASGASLAIEGDPEVDNVLGAVGADLDN